MSLQQQKQTTERGLNRDGASCCFMWGNTDAQMTQHTQTEMEMYVPVTTIHHRNHDKDVLLVNRCPQRFGSNSNSSCVQFCFSFEGETVEKRSLLHSVHTSIGRFQRSMDTDIRFGEQNMLTAGVGAE